MDTNKHRRPEIVDFVYFFNSWIFKLTVLLNLNSPRPLHSMKRSMSSSWIGLQRLHKKLWMNKPKWMNNETLLRISYLNCSGAKCLTMSRRTNDLNFISAMASMSFCFTIKSNSIIPIRFGNREDMTLLMFRERLQSKTTRLDVTGPPFRESLVN